MKKEILFRIEDHPEITVGEIIKLIEEFQKMYPDKEIYLDGDLLAICARPKREEREEDVKE